MSAFCFSIFTGMSVLCFAFLLPNFLKLETSLTLTFEKLKLCALNAFLWADTLGLLPSFITAFKAGWEMHSAEKLIALNSEKTNLVSWRIHYYYLFISLSILPPCTCYFFRRSYLTWQRDVLLFSRTSYYLSHLFHLSFCHNIF